MHMHISILYSIQDIRREVVIEWKEGENNREAKKERDGWRRKEARPQWKISISNGNGSGPPCCSSDRPHLSS